MPELSVEKVVITNFKCFEGEFELPLNEGVNILVGDNDAGKSTIVEAINLALTGFFHGRYLKNELTQYLFSNKAVEQYLGSITEEDHPTPPSIYIDLYFKYHESLAEFQGDCNSRREKGCGVSYAIEFDDQYVKEYEELLKANKLSTLPIEYYTVNWSTFAHEKITARGIPIKAALIEAMASRMQNGSDFYISRIIRDILDESDKVGVAQAHRKLRDLFQGDDSIAAVNTKIQTAVGISEKKVSLAVDLATKNAWETTLMTLVDGIPFHYTGQGEQSIIKTRLALSHKKALEASVLLIEEPENHLTHTNLNLLLNRINKENSEKQIIITTHSSYVANKLNLANLVLLNSINSNKEHTYLKLTSLTEAGNFFMKLPGYDTLRLALSKKAILVEGDSDELIVQKVYQMASGGTLPIANGIEVISVGTAFLRFLEMANSLKKQVAVVTDNDGDVSSLQAKYAQYTTSDTPHIGIFYDTTVDTGSLLIGGKPYNYNTLEPKMLKCNGVAGINSLLASSYSKEDDLRRHMRSNKTEVALKIFSSTQPFTSPDYITDAIAWIKTET